MKKNTMIKSIMMTAKEIQTTSITKMASAKATIIHMEIMNRWKKTSTPKKETIIHNTLNNTMTTIPKASGLATRCELQHQVIRAILTECRRVTGNRPIVSIIRISPWPSIMSSIWSGFTSPNLAKSEKQRPSHPRKIRNLQLSLTARTPEIPALKFHTKRQIKPSTRPKWTSRISIIGPTT